MTCGPNDKNKRYLFFRRNLRAMIGESKAL